MLTRKIQFTPHSHSLSPLTGFRINLSSQFKLPMVTWSVSCMKVYSCSWSIWGTGNMSQWNNSDTETLTFSRKVKYKKETSRATSSQGTGTQPGNLHSGTPAAGNHLQKRFLHWSKTKCVHVKWTEGLFQMLLFSSRIKKLFSMESSRTQSGAIQRNHTNS